MIMADLKVPLLIFKVFGSVLRASSIMDVIVNFIQRTFDILFSSFGVLLVSKIVSIVPVKNERLFMYAFSLVPRIRASVCATYSLLVFSFADDQCNSTSWV